MASDRVLLLVLDGWGLSPERAGNAIAQAATPSMDALAKRGPATELHASGSEVGLPDGVMGNSEVGHLNLGAGRVIYQDILRISRSIQDGSFYENGVLAGL